MSSPQPFGKMEIVNHLAAAHGYRNYLELCTFTTGFKYAEVDRANLDHCHRLMYAVPADFDDGMPIDFRIAGFDITDCVREIARQNFRYDVMLVDPWHLYETSLRDLEAAFTLIAHGGSFVVHDCLPPDAWMADPVWREGPWCGATYKAFLDFVLGRDDLAYYTVDTDFGCGVIRKGAPGVQPERLIPEWRKFGNDLQAAYRFFVQHQRELLNLVTVEEFKRRERIPPLVQA